MMADLDACNELADSLYSRIKNFELQEKRDQVIYNNLMSDKASLENQVKDLTELKDLYKSGEKKERTKNRLVKGLAAGFGIVAAAEAVWIGIASSFGLKN